MSKMYNWNADLDEPRRPSYLNVILFASAASLSLLLFLIFAPQIQKIIAEFPLLIEIAYFPTLIIGFIFGMKVTERAIKPSEIRSPIKRGIVKILLFFFIIGGLFSAVSFALGGGISIPAKSVLEMELTQWATQFVTQNGGLTFLILSGISLMAVATRRMIGLDGIVNSISTFVGTFFFFSMIALSLSNTNPSHSQVYLYTFYHAGIIGGALYQMNKMTSKLNMWEDYSNGY